MTTARKITDTTLAMIHELREQGLKHGEIGEALGLSLRSVGAVISGAWQPPVERVKEPKVYTEQPRHRGPFVRCGSCGGRCQKPCMVCEMRGRA